MRKFALLALFIFLSSPAWAACSSYPYTLTNGTPADANQVMSNFNTVMNCASTAQGTPQGRLTLTSNTPVMTADATAQSTVYYDCYTGNSVPVYNGTVTGAFAVGSCQMSLALNSSNQTSGNLYDVFAFNNSGTLTLCAGPAWISGTARSATITASLGYWTNSASLTHCYNGATDYGTISANQATYLGTLYATANGQTGMAFSPTPTAGGTNNILGIYNAYNRVRTVSRSAENTPSWTYATPSFRPENNSTSNRVTWVDGLGQSFVEARHPCNLASTGGATGYCMLALDNTSNPVTGYITTYGSSTLTAPISVYSENNTAPLLGLHYFQAVEYATSSTITYYGQPMDAQVIVSLEM